MILFLLFKKKINNNNWRKSTIIFMEIYVLWKGCIKKIKHLSGGERIRLKLVDKKGSNILSYEIGELEDCFEFKYYDD